MEESFPSTTKTNLEKKCWEVCAGKHFSSRQTSCNSKRNYKGPPVLLTPPPPIRPSTMSGDRPRPIILADSCSPSPDSCCTFHRVVSFFPGVNFFPRSHCLFTGMLKGGWRAGGGGWGRRVEEGGQTSASRSIIQQGETVFLCNTEDRLHLSRPGVMRRAMEPR